jgi:hypothetical protein
VQAFADERGHAIGDEDRVWVYGDGPESDRLEWAGQQHHAGHVDCRAATRHLRRSPKPSETGADETTQHMLEEGEDDES